MFDDHPLPAQVLPVQLVDSVVGIAVVLEFHETISEGGKGSGKSYEQKVRRRDDKVLRGQEMEPLSCYRSVSVSSAC